MAEATDILPHLKVFIVGPARSGTSSLYHAISTVFKLPGCGESHLMPLVQRAIYQSRVYWKGFKENNEDILIKKFPIDEWEQVIFEHVREFYRAEYGGDRWIDKTPSSEAIHGVSLIRKLFPDAKIICTKRNGLEVVRSRQMKFNEGFEAACREWSGAMEGITAHVKKDTSCLLIDQKDLNLYQSRIANQLSVFLGDGSLANALDDSLSANIIEGSENRNQHELHLENMNWSDENKNLFLEFCGNQMRSFDYEF